MGRKIIRCARCNRRLKYPVWVNGKAYGSTCATYVQPEIDYRAEIRSLQNQVRELTTVIQELKMNGDVTTTTVSPPSSPSNTEPQNPLGMNYGCDHGALMDELKSVLKERACA